MAKEYDGVVIRIDAGKEAPIRFLKSVSDEQQGVAGVAVVAPRGDDPNDCEILTNQLAGAWDFGAMVKFMDDNKAFPRVFFLGNFPAEGYDEADIPPYDVLVAAPEKEGDPPDILLTLFLEGNFEHDIGDSPRWQAHHVFEELLQEQITDLYKAADTDIDAFFHKAKSKGFEKAMKSCIGNRGSITLVGYNGDVVTYSKGDVGKEYDWGWASYIANDVEDLLAQGKEPPAAVEEKAPISMAPAGKKRAAMGPTVPSVNPNEAKLTVTTETIKANNNPQNTTSMTPVGAKRDFYVWKCPENIKGNEAIRAAYLANTGTIPKEFKKKPEVTVAVPEGHTLKSFQEIAVTYFADQRKKNDAAPPADTKEAEGQRMASAVTGEEKRLLIDAVLPKIKDRANKQGKSPDEIYAMEESLPGFHDLAGWDNLDELFGTDFYSRRELAQKCPGITAILISNLMWALKDALENAADEEVTEVDAATTAAAAAQATAEAEEAARAAAAAASAPAPKRRAVM